MAQVTDETAYNVRTPQEVIDVLETARRHRIRIQISYGDVETGRDWLEEYDIRGYVSRSTGVPIPILLANTQSMEGGGILDQCIVRILKLSNGDVLYQHPNYHTGELRRRTDCLESQLPVVVYRDGIVHARFKDIASAVKWAQKLRVFCPIA